MFEFGDTLWRQTRGTAMGAVPAVDCAVLCVGLLERIRILGQHKDNILFYSRFVDDGIGVWQEVQNEKNNWTHFNETLNDWGTLKWTATGCVDKLVFLDMITSINKDGNLHYKSCEKPMNLHQCLSPASNHPPVTLQGLVFGMLQSHWEQNSWVSDFEKIASKFALCLMSWGYSLQSMTPLFEGL